jgi:hypothetical protein
MLTLTAADCRFIVTLAGQNCRFTLTRDTSSRGVRMIDNFSN